MLAKKGIKAQTISDAFLKKPLYNTLFKEGFGTLFTAVYRPAERTVETRWPNISVKQTFADFKEVYKLINYDQAEIVQDLPGLYDEVPSETAQAYYHPVEKETLRQVEWQETVTETLVNAMAQANPAANKEQLEALRGKLLNRGEVSWEVLADFWSKMGSGYSDSWKN